MSPFRFSPVVEAKQALQLGHILSRCFNTSLDQWRVYTQQLGFENLRLLHHGDQIVGGLGIYPMGQWFGGQSVPMGGLAAVGVSPEHRGIGAAATLLTQTLRELQGQGVPLAALYASTAYLYRQVGFELAGSRCRFSVPLQTVTLTDRTLPVAAIEPCEQPLITYLYQQRVQRTNGNLARHPALWDHIFDDSQTPVYADTIGESAAPEGYVVFTQQSSAGAYDLQIRDGVVLTPAAGRRLWTLLADHRSLGRRVFWEGPSIDPLLSLLPEQTYRVEHLERWLLRIVDVAKALSLRGYPPGVEAELHFDVADDLLPMNRERFILTVSAGQAEVTIGGRGDLKLDVRGLAPLYTSLLTPQQLEAIGYLVGSEGAIATAAQIFAGPEPWMSDHF